MKDYQREFIEFAINMGVLKFGQFTLKSGRISPYFFNAGLFNTGESLAKIGKFYAAALEDGTKDVDYDVLFGPAYKGIPLVSSTAVAMSNIYKKDVPFCFNRKEKKDHGEGGTIVGTELTPDKKVIIVDDVITAGTAIREAVEIIQVQNKAKLVGVLIALDRQEKGKDTDSSAIQQVEKEFGIPVICIVKLEHVIEYLESIGGWDESVKQIREYRKQYGV